ncbi:S1 family peptidase [Promicromonospora soli]
MLVGIAGLGEAPDALATDRISAEDPSEDDLPDDTTADVGHELAIVAAQRGITVAEADAAIGWQDSFARLATDLESAHPADFAGAEISSEVPAVGTIRFKGVVPAGVGQQLTLEALDGFNVRLEGGAGLSAVDVDELVIDVHSAVRDVAKDRLAEMVSYYDKSQRKVIVTARPLDLAGLDLASSNVAATEIVAALPSRLESVADVVLDTSLSNATEARYGGGRLEASGGSTLRCTSGFNVRGSGTTGVATAGHCANGLTHENVSGGIEFSLDYQSGHRGNWGDFQWHTSAESEPDDFYYIAGVRRDVSARVNPVVGQTLCRYGHATGAHCNTVSDTSLCATLDGIETCRLVRMTGDTAEGGDSGGPLYYGTSAYGFHTGQVGCAIITTCDVWSRVTYIDDALGVTVRIS